MLSGWLVDSEVMPQSLVVQLELQVWQSVGGTPHSVPHMLSKPRVQAASRLLLTTDSANDVRLMGPLGLLMSSIRKTGQTRNNDNASQPSDCHSSQYSRHLWSVVYRLCPY